MTPPAPTADDLWQTALFLPGPRAASGEISPRLAYQLLLHGRAVVVDARDDATRARQGEIDPALAHRADGVPQHPRVTVVATTPTPGALTLAGGVAAWVAAGLPALAPAAATSGLVAA